MLVDSVLYNIEAIQPNYYVAVILMKLSLNIILHQNHLKIDFLKTILLGYKCSPRAFYIRINIAVFHLKS